MATCALPLKGFSQQCRSMVQEIQIAFVRRREGSWVRKEQIVLAMIAFQLINAFVCSTSSVTSRRQCVLAGDALGQNETSPLRLAWTKASLGRPQPNDRDTLRRRFKQLKHVVDEYDKFVVATVQRRSRRSMVSDRRRPVRGVGVYTTVQPPQTDNEVLRFTPNRIKYDFDQTIGDRLISFDDGLGDVERSSTPLSVLTDVEPVTVVEVSLGSCRIRVLPPRLLVDMIRLERLALWVNEINRIPDGFFDDAVRLREIVMWNNRLERLEPDAFVPSTALDDTDETDTVSPLQLLDLDRNRISFIGPTSSAQNRGIPGADTADDPWRLFPQLRVLRLSGNRITSIVAGTFRGLSGLRSLTLSANGLAFMHSEAFAGLTSLARLSLNDNAIVFVPDGLFASLGRLVELDLSGNKIEHVWSRTLVGLRLLRRLDLTGNRLSQVPDDTFGSSTTPRLALLVLDDNRLRTLRRCVFPPQRTAAERTILTTLERRNEANIDQNDLPLFPLSLVDKAPRRLLSVIGNAGMLCDCRLRWLAGVVKAGELTTVWGSCDVRQLETASSSSLSESPSLSASVSTSMSSLHHHRLSPTSSSGVVVPSPIQAAIVRGFFNACHSSSECLT